MTKKVTIHKDSPINKDASPFGEDTMNLHIWGWFSKSKENTHGHSSGVNIPNIAGVTPVLGGEWSPKESETLHHIDVNSRQINLHITGKEFWLHIGYTGHRYVYLSKPGRGYGVKLYHYKNIAGKWVKKLVKD